MRCHLIVWLSLINLCFSFSYGGYEPYPQDPRLIPQAQPGYYPQQPYQPQYNPYPAAGNYAPQEEGDYYNGYNPSQSYNDFVQLDEQEQATGGSTGGATTTTTTATAPSVQTPTQTQTPAATAAATAPAANANMDALDIQLAAALDAVKADMISKGKEVLEEKQWTDDVKSVIAQYQTKISNVYVNIENLKTDMGTLYKKKQQILNAQLQKELTAKLADSKADLATVETALDKVTNTEAEFEQSKSDIQGTIDSIYSQLAELKGTVTAGAGASTTAAAAGGAAPGAAAGAAAGTQAAAAPAPAAASSSDSSDSSDVSDQDIVDKKAEISSKIDTIKGIVDALTSP